MCLFFVPNAFLHQFKRLELLHTLCEDSNFQIPTEMENKEKDEGKLARVGNIWRLKCRYMKSHNRHPSVFAALTYLQPLSLLYSSFIIWQIMISFCRL